jgi:hypothetical protein
MKKQKQPRYQKILEARTQMHGSWRLAHRNVGLIWAGILSDHFGKPIPPIPAHVCALMMTAFKVGRAVRPYKYSADHYDDARNYLDFAQAMAPKGRKREKRPPRRRAES